MTGPRVVLDRTGLTLHASDVGVVFVGGMLGTLLRWGGLVLAPESGVAVVVVHVVGTVVAGLLAARHGDHIGGRPGVGRAS